MYTIDFIIDVADHLPNDIMEARNFAIRKIKYQFEDYDNSEKILSLLKSAVLSSDSISKLKESLYEFYEDVTKEMEPLEELVQKRKKTMGKDNVKHVQKKLSKRLQSLESYIKSYKEVKNVELSDNGMKIVMDYQNCDVEDYARRLDLNLRNFHGSRFPMRVCPPDVILINDSEA